MSVNSFENYPMSWKPQLSRSDKPIYIELAEKLEGDIRNGILLPGTKLPPQRELADYLDINLSTISRAFKICSQKGLLSGNVGSGTFVAYNTFTNLVHYPSQEKQLIRLDSMTPETLPQEELTDLLQKMMAEQSFPDLFQYNFGLSAWQRQTAASLLMRAGCKCDADSILLAGGGQNALAAIFAGLFSPGDRLGVDPLVYPGVKSLAQMFGIQLVPIALLDGEMSEDGIRYAVKNDGIKAIYTTPDYQNPTASIMSTKCRHMLGHLAKELDLLIIEDGICSLLAQPMESIHSCAPENSIYILSLSKSLSPALKLAYLSVPAKYKATLDAALYNINLSQSGFLIELASRLIASRKFEELLKRRALGIEQRNKLVDIILRDFEVAGDKHSLSRWLKLPDGMSGAEFEAEALKNGVCVYGAEHFAVGKNCPVSGARLAICAPQSIDELERGLIIIRDILK